MILLKGFSFSYGQNKIFENAEFRIEHTKGLFGLIGRNGVGKTTLFDLLAGFQDVQSGEYIKDISRDQIGILTQNMGLPSALYVHEAIELIFLLNDSAIKKASYALCQRFDKVIANRLTGLLHKRIGFLSRGELRLLCICLALYFEKKVYLLDEPTAAVDPEIRYEIWTLLKKEANENNKLFLVSDHMLNQIGDYVDQLFLIRSHKIFSYQSMYEFISYYKATCADEAFVKAYQEEA